MSSKILNISSSENIIEYIVSYLPKKLDRTAIISGGKRPFLFIKKNLADRYNSSFYPPVFFTNDDFVGSIMLKSTSFSKIPELESLHLLYKITQQEAPEILKGKKTFESFIQWAFEILKFIDQLDLEKVSKERIKNIKANADIGFDVPENINSLIKNIFKIREQFHKKLEEMKSYTKGYAYYKSQELGVSDFAEDFDEIILLAPLYLHKSELELYKELFNLGKLTIIIQGNPHKYLSLKKIYDYLGKPLPESKNDSISANINIYSAYDDQSQAVLLKNLVAGIKSKEDLSKSVVIVPKNETIQPVISEISQLNLEYNVSSGYPVSKTAVFTLLRCVIDAQLSKRDDKYYVKDVVKVLTNPLVKNMRFFGDLSVSRIIVHKIEEALDLSSKSKLSGRLFVDINDLLNDNKLIDEISETIVKSWEIVDKDKIKTTLGQMWRVLFSDWENITTLSALSKIILMFMKKLAELSSLQSYPLNIEAVEIITNYARELNFGEVSKEIFKTNESFNIFLNLIEDKKIALQGSPLKGLQVLGLLESRNLTFENVVILNMTDSAMPALAKDFPLIPKDIMFSLGIEIASRDFEIQEYHFDRLISGAKNIHFIYPDNEKEERSRFIEKIIWDKQLKNTDLNAVKILQLSVEKPKNSQNEKGSYQKTPEILEYLKNMKYSYTKIDTYLRCKQEFYFKYILGIDENIEVGQELSGSDIGSFVHKFFQQTLYENLSFKEISSENFKKNFMQKLSDSFDKNFDVNFREDSFLIKRVLMFRLERFINFLKKKDFGKVYGCEKHYEAEIETKKSKYRLECIIDRIDENDGFYNIYDYKTGNVESKLITPYFDDLQANASTDDIKKAVKSFQLPLYKYIFEKSTSLKVKECGLFDIKKSELVTFPQENKIYEKSINIVKEILDEINACGYFEFSEKGNKNCGNCKYLSVCR